MAAETGDRIGRGFGEEQSVKGAVEDVAQGSGENQGSADQYAGRDFAFARAAPQEPADDRYHRDAENPEQQFAPVKSAGRGDVHAESRALVLDEDQLEPVGEDHDRFAQHEVGFYPDLERLVGDEQQRDQCGEFFRIH